MNSRPTQASDKTITARQRKLEFSFDNNERNYQRARMDPLNIVPAVSSTDLDFQFGNSVIIHKMVIRNEKGQILLQKEILAEERETDTLTTSHKPPTGTESLRRDQSDRKLYLPAGKNRPNENVHEGRDRKLLLETGLSGIQFDLGAVRLEGHWLEIIWLARVQSGDFRPGRHELTEGCVWLGQMGAIQALDRFKKGVASAEDRQFWSKIRFWDIGVILQQTSRVTSPLSQLGDQSSRRHLIQVAAWRFEVEPEDPTVKTWEAREKPLMIVWPPHCDGADMMAILDREIRQQCGSTIRSQKGAVIHGVSGYSHHGSLRSQGFVCRVMVSFCEFLEWDMAEWIPGSRLSESQERRAEFESAMGKKSLPRFLNYW